MTTTRGPFLDASVRTEQTLPAASPLTCLFPVSPLRDSVLYLREAQVQSLASIKDLKQRLENVLPRALTKPRIPASEVKDSKVRPRRVFPMLPAPPGRLWRASFIYCKHQSPAPSHTIRSTDKRWPGWAWERLLPPPPCLQGENWQNNSGTD